MLLDRPIVPSGRHRSYPQAPVRRAAFGRALASPPHGKRNASCRPRPTIPPASPWPWSPIGAAGRPSCNSAVTGCRAARLHEPLDERDRLVADLAPAAVDRQRVTAALDLDDFGHAVAAALVLERRVGDRVRNRGAHGPCCSVVVSGSVPPCPAGRLLGWVVGAAMFGRERGQSSLSGGPSSDMSCFSKMAATTARSGVALRVAGHSSS